MESNSGRWPLISQLFNDLADLDPQQRRERLSQIGADDPGVRAAVESLLDADAEADERLSRFDVGVSQVIRTSTLGVSADSSDPLGIIGRMVGQFRVRAFVAAGGMGVVYEADDTRLSRSVALKFPLPHHPIAERIKARFIREAQAAGALDHINLCPVYEVGESKYGLFLAMPLYRGTTLKQTLIDERSLSVERALDIARQLALGLRHAHAAGIVHRDLKPGNVMVLPDGTVKILDFGLARTQDAVHTKSEVTLGTVSYMAPEQIRGAKVDARADLWSLGVILYESLTGERPFTGDREAAVAHAILHNDPKPLSTLRPDLPSGLRELILSLLRKDTSVRYPSAQKVLEDIGHLAQGLAPAFRPAFGPRVIAWTRRRRLPLAIGAVVAATAGMVVAVPRLQARLSKPTGNKQAYEFYLRAREFERLGPPAAAESLYLRAIALDTSFALARARLAIVYAECQAGGSRDCFRRSAAEFGIDRLEQIRTTAEAALKQQPRLPEAHFAMGLYWERREDPARAIAEYELALPGMRKSGPLHAAWARAYRTQGHWDRAIQELERAIALDPADVASMGDLATTYSRLRRYDESARWWNQYLARVPNAYEGATIKGHVYLRWLGTLDTLVAILDGLPEQERKRSYATRFLVARLQHRLPDAVAVLDEWPARPPQDTSALQHPALLRAQVYADMGDSSRARAWFDSARVQLEPLAQRRPGNFRAQVALGLAYAGLGRASEAKQAADSALILMPFTRSVILAPLAMKGAAEVYAQLPQHHHLAIALLDSLLRVPAGREVSVPLLRLEPQWTPLRDNPAFRALLTRYAPQ